jgi:hypothetical protein
MARWLGVLMGLGCLTIQAAAEPLNIARQGSLEAGGRVVECLTNDGGDSNSKRWPPGHVVVDNVYATFQYPVGHTMMLEKNNKQIMFRMIAWLEGHVAGRK